MTGARFRLVNACASEPFAGVPLAAVEGAKALSPSQMLLIARELNQSLTAFLLPPRDPTNSARALIFSPQGECDLRLEAVLALSALLAKDRAGDVLRRGGLTIALEVGDACWHCDVIVNSAGICYSEVKLAPRPRRVDPARPAEGLAAALGLARGAIGSHGHHPSRFETCGALDLLPVRTRDALLTVAPEEKFAAAATGVLLYTHDTAAAGGAIEARIIGAGVGAEALVALAGAVVEFDRPGEGAHEFFVDLLHEHGRRARLTLRFEIADGALDSLSLGAQTVSVAKGELCR